MVLFTIALALVVQVPRQINVLENPTATKAVIISTIQPTQRLQPVEITAEEPFPLVRLAWFTNVPGKQDLINVLGRFDLFILHRNEVKGRDSMVSLGAKGLMLQYLLFQAIHDPGSCVAEPNANQAAFQPGDFCTISTQHSDWFLLDRQGQRIRVQDDGDDYYLMDPGNSEWRAFCLDRIRQTQVDPNWDGIFLDNVPVTLAHLEKSGKLPAAYPDDADYQAAVQGFLKYLYEGFFQSEDKRLFANLVSRKDEAAWANQLNFLDGVMHEGWAIDWPDRYRPAETWEKQMLLAEQTQDMGKTIILVSQGTRDDTTLQEFAFASYLLVNHGKAFFRYANSDKYREVWLYADYTVNLGAPLGSRYLDSDTWRRDFTNGHVVVNPETHEAEIYINR